MEQKIIFREMLSEALKLADAKGNRLTTEEIDAFFANTHLDRQQMELVYEYLAGQKVKVEGYEPKTAPLSRELEKIAPEKEEPDESEKKAPWNCTWRRSVGFPIPGKGKNGSCLKELPGETPRQRAVWWSCICRWYASWRGSMRETRACRRI